MVKVIKDVKEIMFGLLIILIENDHGDYEVLLT